MFMPSFPFTSVRPAEEDPVGSIFGAQQGAEDPYASLMGTLEAALAERMNAPGPEQMQVPGQMNPFASMAATFSGLLSQQLGAPGASDMVQQRLAQREQAPAQAEQYNRTLNEQERRQRMQDSLMLRGKIIDAKIAALINEHFDLRPGAIIRDLNLRRPIFRQVAAYGHFGRDDLDLTWEKTDRAAALRAAAGL